MNDAYDTPEEIKSRRALFSRFARLRAIQEEKNRPKEDPDQQQSSSSNYNPWMTDKENATWKINQLEYTIPHKAEYEDTSRFHQEIDANQQDDSASTTTTSTKRSIMEQLNSLRGRHKKGFNPTTRSSVCNDFERTSTIMPPTEVPAGDFNTNISTEELRSQFFVNYKANTDLPIYKHRTHIINSINSYSVIIIEGATGCGKTTQVPLYILEDAIMQRPCGKSPVIYVTQPRRIAARSIAERVCSEHNWALGSIVGYQVSLDKKTGNQTVLTYCTAGVLLQKLIKEKTLQSYTHIIIDEAHERDADTDLLLMMIRTLMRKEMPFFRLIVMSATMDTSKLRKYFTFKTNFGHQALTMPSNIAIPPGRISGTSLQVVSFDKLKSLFGVELEGQVPNFEMDNPEQHETCLKTAVKIIVDVIPHLDTFCEETKSTLVFLPGYAEISKLDRMLRAIPGVVDNIDIIPLHSCLTVMDQIRVFQPARPGCRKVILSTNIAESSITVPDVGFIIDFCLTKTLMKDNVTRFPTLRLQWSTQDKCTQRAGRTGRCCAGKVFRMVPNSFYEKFKKFADPELLTAPLELSVLRVKSFQMGELQALFAVVLDPPPFNEIRTAVLELKQIGALSSTYKGKVSDVDGDLTELGRIISALPIDVRLSKLIVIASVFDVLEDAIVVAACLSTNRTVVKHMYGNLLETYDNKLDWANGSNSDLFVSLDVVYEYRDFKESKCKSDRWLAQWCAKRCLDERKLQEVDALVNELKVRLEQVNITIFEQPNRERDVNEDNLMLKIAFCAAFYPNYFITQQFDVRNVKKELCGLDPTNTVIMYNIPVNQVPLYRTQIVKQITENVCQDLDFVADCSRALLILHDDIHATEDESIRQAIGDYNVLEPSRTVQRSVYRALKMGDMGDHTEIREFKDLAAHERMQYYWKQKEEICQALGRKLMPSWFKIVDGPANNDRLFNANEEEFSAIIKENYFIELEFDHDQDQQDEHELYELERFESIEGQRVEHQVFKNTTRRIKGPDSPIRMSFRSVLEKSRGFSVDIDPHSVNSILLDPDFEKDRRQLLVAAAVTQNKRGKVMARDTTLMPNIRGLPTLMALLFAQYYKFVYNEKMKCIMGGVFGIGWNEHDVPIDRLYEVELGFDIHITLDDVALINKAREKISELLKFTEIRNAGKPQAQLQRQLRDIILTLLRKRRYPLLEMDLGDVDGITLVKDKYSLAAGIDNHVDDGPFLPIMSMSRNYHESDMFRVVRDNLNTLNRIHSGEEKPPRNGINCLLCGNGIKSFLLLYKKIINHILSEDHIEKVKEFEAYERLATGRE